MCPCSLFQGRIGLEFLPEFGPETEPKTHRTPVQSAPQPPRRCVNQLHWEPGTLSCHMDWMWGNPHPIRICESTLNMNMWSMCGFCPIWSKVPIPCPMATDSLNIVGNAFDLSYKRSGFYLYTLKIHYYFPFPNQSCAIRNVCINLML